ncbi:hypothetical protein FQS87_08205 [Enterococcus avium]|uniref:hypothetical protein n=1 Tax=Enterococcus TaxID=1350 RepID=UPI001A9675AA|nr:hypothetical protein [Enterococcus avium]MBO1139877.1 hypothetical protein [Enterococcus avium]
MDIYASKQGSYRLIEENNELILDIPTILSLVQTVLDDEYTQLDLNIDEVIMNRQKNYELEQRKYEELPDETNILKAFNLDIKLFSNLDLPVYRGYEEIDRDEYFDRKSQGFYKFYCLLSESDRLLN